MTVSYPRGRLVDFGTMIAERKLNIPVQKTASVTLSKLLAKGVRESGTWLDEGSTHHTAALDLEKMEPGEGRAEPFAKG